MHILIVEDDDVLRDSLVRAMCAAGYAADPCRDGEEALALLRGSRFDLAILDIGLPGIDGLEVLREIRTRGLSLPVILLTARDAVEDRVHGLDLGADDYLTKPFSVAELEARTRALLRRGHGGQPLLACGALAYDSVDRTATLDGMPVEFSHRELAVLETLLFRQGRVVSKEQLIDSLCAQDNELTPNAIEVYISRLRKKLEPGGITIRTLRGLGYALGEKGNGPQHG